MARWFAALLCLAIPLLAGAASPHEPSERELREANLRYDRARVDADEDALRSIYSPEFMYIGSNGATRDKDHQIYLLASGAVDIVAGESDQIGLRMYGDIAVIFGRFTGEAAHPGAPPAFRERYTRVWRLSAGTWRLAHEQVAAIPDPAAAGH